MDKSEALRVGVVGCGYQGRVRELSASRLVDCGGAWDGPYASFHSEHRWRSEIWVDSCFDPSGAAPSVGAIEHFAVITSAFRQPESCRRVGRSVGRYRPLLLSLPRL